MFIQSASDVLSNYSLVKRDRKNVSFISGTKIKVLSRVNVVLHILSSRKLVSKLNQFDKMDLTICDYGNY